MFIGACVVGKSGEAGNERHVRRLGLAISFRDWVCIGCVAK
jgi:hypothetical protein